MTASIASYDERDREAVVRRRVQGMNGGSGKPAERLVGTAVVLARSPHLTPSGMCVAR